MDFNEAARLLYAQFGFKEIGESDGYVDAVFVPKHQATREGSVGEPSSAVEANQPYALASPAERARRADMAHAPHMKPLTEYLNQVKQRQGDGYDLPAFDPLDGGIHARALFLLEAPGPKAVGSAFISRNNPDPTARNFCELLADSDILRRDTLIWNTVPWYVGDGAGRIRPVSRQDIAESLPYLDGLLALLRDLKLIVLVGNKSQSAASDIRARTRLPFVTMPHPSARVFNVWPEKRVEAQKALNTVAAFLREA